MTDLRTLKRIFIANRGEIARRIALTASRMGIETVAISDRDVPPQFLAEATTYVYKVAEESPALYLNMEEMIRIAKETGCDSVHPGFGFLSENEAFARTVQKAGLIWIGPNPDAIAAMASKSTARDYAIKASVPCISGLSGFHTPTDESGDFSEIESFADKTGYPLLIKAAYGGGGKGMRIVQKKEDIRPAVLRAHSEAVNSFGNGMLICEQYLTAPRHIEVQILADQQGHVFAVGDRDCSMQRRHQKIIEEAPAPQISPATRKAMHEAAISLASKVGYDSTGTVEFLLDWSDTARKKEDQSFYFLEMNTRLQVEHPVSEEVFDIDLVEWQIRVARGEAIPKDTVQDQPRGHSIELRIYAEDAESNFFPSPGPVAAFLPASGPGIRWELGLDPMDEITGRFDPMIAKLIATAATREGALQRLSDAMRRSFFAGPVNNIPLLQVLVSDSQFVKEPVTTHFMQDQLEAVLAKIMQSKTKLKERAEMVLDLVQRGSLPETSYTGGAPDPTTITNWIFSGNSKSHQKANDAASEGTDSLQIRQLSSGMLSSPYFKGAQTVFGCASTRQTDGNSSLFWYASLSAPDGKAFWVMTEGTVFHREGARARSDHGSQAAAATEGTIAAPVPGKVIAVKVQPGQTVEAGAVIFILESMKMEFEVKAARSGEIAHVNVTQGIQVAAGAVLADWKE